MPGGAVNGQSNDDESTVKILVIIFQILQRALGIITQIASDIESYDSRLDSAEKHNKALLCQINGLQQKNEIMASDITAMKVSQSSVLAQLKESKRRNACFSAQLDTQQQNSKKSVERIDTLRSLQDGVVLRLVALESPNEDQRTEMENLQQTVCEIKRLKISHQDAVARLAFLADRADQSHQDMTSRTDRLEQAYSSAIQALTGEACSDAKQGRNLLAASAEAWRHYQGNAQTESRTIRDDPCSTVPGLQIGVGGKAREWPVTSCFGGSGRYQRYKGSRGKREMKITADPALARRWTCSLTMLQII